MEILYTLISVVGGVLSLVGYVILVVVGFKRSVLWGFVNMLVPFGSVVFGIKYWEEARVGCLMTIVAFVLSVGAAFMFGGIAGLAGLQDMQGVQEQMEEQIRAEQEAAARAEGTLGGAAESSGSESGSGETVTPSSTVADEPRPEKPKERRFAYQETDVGFLPGQIGKPVQIVTKDGREHAGTLIAIEDDIIRIEKRMRGGSMEFFLREPEVQSVKVLEEVQ